MLSKNLLEALNDQMNHEYFAAHAYMAMAAYCDKESYEAISQTSSFKQAKEERFHGQKIYNYINDRGAHAEFRAVSAPKIDFSSILETFKDSLSTIEVTRRFYNLSEIARQDKNYQLSHS